MMGQRGGNQDRLFYSFNLDDQVPRGHLLRGIDRFFDLGELRHHLAPFYSHTGRPSIDPELMIRMLIVGYCFGIRSERRLCEEVQLNLAYRWFCRLDLEAAVPDHSTFSKNRHGRFRESDAFRYVFESVLRRCMNEGLVGGEGFAVDASVIKADANRARGVPGAEVIDWNKGDGPTRAVREYLAALEENNSTSDGAGDPSDPPDPPDRQRPLRTSHSPIPPHAGPLPQAARPSSPTRPTTSSICRQGSSSTSRPRPRTERRRSTRRGRWSTASRSASI